MANLSTGDRSAFEALIDRLKNDALGQSADPVQQDLDHALLQRLETACQETLAGDHGLQWSLVQWGELGAGGLGQPRIEPPSQPTYVAAFTNVRMEATEQRGCVASGGWVLPVNPALTVDTDANHAELVELGTALHCDKEELLHLCRDQAWLSIYFDPGPEVAKETFDAWANLKAAAWVTRNDQTDAPHAVSVTAAPPVSVDEPAVWSRITNAGFPFSARIIHLPLSPLLEGGADDCLRIYVDVGSAQTARRIAEQLSGRLKLNVMPVVNAWKCLDDAYCAGAPFETPASIASAVTGVTVLSAHRAGVPATERRWMRSCDQANLLFDVKACDGSWSLCPASGLPDQGARWRVHYLFNLTWGGSPDLGDMGTVDNDGRGLSFRLLTTPVPVRQRLLDRLTRHAIPASRGDINTREDLRRVCDQCMPPLLRQASEDVIIRTCFGPDPADLDARHAVPLTSVVCKVAEPKAPVLISQARWLRDEIGRLGLPLGTVIDVCLEAVDHG
ncbi:hypothetical protein U5801_21560 [Lamprobacter modestohalophilus]|uniref:hypothetical protein n=1 Tax=Lamprobacter modestohalophilus TaxID=1064514 RepID=UPI002ADEF710|nr:hypothetical protein [Lamprobacter modestohalophilus]MEA1052372.1 hypothetical protein [Lamprobacter modestohalophilus]